MPSKLILFNLIFALLVFPSCKEENESLTPQDRSGDESNELLGDWHIIERLVDPGDGSGTFQSVNEDKSVTFLADMTFQSSQPLCNLITGSHDTGSGQYSLSAKTITPDNCDFDVELRYEIVEEYLIIHYFCIEACSEKYSRTNLSD